MKKYVLALLLLALLVPGRAEEQPLEITLSGQITESAVLSERGMAAANQVLGRLAIRQTAWASGERAVLVIDGNDMWSVERREENRQVHVIFSDETCYVTEKNQPDALVLLAGQAESRQLSPFSLEGYGAFAPAFYARLQAMAEPLEIEGTVAVENAAYSPKYLRYQLPAEGLNAAWPDMAAQAWACFFPEGGDPAAFEEISRVQFTGDTVQVKRLMGRQGEDMGVQLTGQGLVMGTERKIALTLGYTPDKGGSLTLSAKALKGTDSLRAEAAIRETATEEKNSLRFSAAFTNRLGEEERAWKTEGSLTETKTPEGSRVNGKITGEADGIAYTLEPELVKTETGIQGTVDVTLKEKKKTIWKMQLSLHIRPGTLPETDGPEREILLEGLSPEEAQQKLFGENVVLMRAITYLLDGLPSDERWQLTHDLKNDSWLNGPDVPVLEETGHTWMVEEEEP